jgi:hypothetical protein
MGFFSMLMSIPSGPAVLAILDLVELSLKPESGL